MLNDRACMHFRNFLKSNFKKNENISKELVVVDEQLLLGS